MRCHSRIFKLQLRCCVCNASRAQSARQARAEALSALVAAPSPYSDKARASNRTMIVTRVSKRERCHLQSVQPCRKYCGFAGSTLVMACHRSMCFACVRPGNGQEDNGDQAQTVQQKWDLEPAEPVVNASLTADAEGKGLGKCKHAPHLPNREHLPFSLLVRFAQSRRTWPSRSISICI